MPRRQRLPANERKADATFFIAGMSAPATYRSRPFEEGSNVEKLRAAQDGPDKVGTAHRDGLPVPTSGVAWTPSAEMADRRDLESCDRSGRPGPSPGWGTKK